MIKRILALSLSLILVFSLVACQDNASLEDPNSNENQQQSTHDAFDQQQDESFDQSLADQSEALEEEPEDSSGSDQTDQAKAVEDQAKTEADEQTDKEPTNSKDEEDSSPQGSLDKDQDQSEEKSQASISISIEGVEEEYLYKNSDYPISQEDMTALDLLKELEEAGEIRFEYSGTKSTAYLQGINDYYEFDHGPLSGWMLEVNGEFPLKSIGSLKIKDSDIVRFRYTLELGDDLTD